MGLNPVYAHREGIHVAEIGDARARRGCAVPIHHVLIFLLEEQ
jgi:hypothetical protein